MSHTAHALGSCWRISIDTRAAYNGGEQIYRCLLYVEVEMTRCRPCRATRKVHGTKHHSQDDVF